MRRVRAPSPDPTTRSISAPDCDPPPGLDRDFWLGPAPKKPYNPNYFLHDYWFFDYAGSLQCDWAVHHYDVVHWAMGVDRPKTVMAMGGMMCFPENNLQYPDTHAEVFLECVRNRKEPAASVEVGHYATIPGHLINIAWRSGHKNHWDAEKEEVKDDPDANALVH